MAVRTRADEGRKPTRSGHSLGLFDDLVGAGKDEGGTVRPSAFAVLRLTTNPNVTACWTGRSTGFSPLRILSA